MKYKNIWANWEPPAPRVEGPNLVPMYGASTESLATLRCQSVHPCRACSATGFVDHVACGRCRGTGIAEIRKGSMLYCEVCSKSGMDHLPIMQRDPLTDPKPEPKKAEPSTPASSPAKSNQTRRERRASQPA